MLPTLLQYHATPVLDPGSLPFIKFSVVGDIDEESADGSKNEKESVQHAVQDNERAYDSWKKRPLENANDG